MADETIEASESGHALVDEIAAKIRARIMSGDIPIGAQLRQAELAQRLRRQPHPGPRGAASAADRRTDRRRPQPRRGRSGARAVGGARGLRGARRARGPRGRAVGEQRVSSGDLDALRAANQAMYDRSVAERDQANGGPRQPRENDIFHSTIAELSAQRAPRTVDRRDQRDLPPQRLRAAAGQRQPPPRGELPRAQPHHRRARARRCRSRARRDARARHRGGRAARPLVRAPLLDGLHGLIHR